MTRFVHIDYPTQHPGVERVSRGLSALGGFSATRAVLHALAVVGSPLTAVAGAARRALAANAAARKQRREDQALWNLALTDARIMADLSRAMSREAVRSARYY
jgi:hypothetical protein